MAIEVKEYHDMEAVADAAAGRLDRAAQPMLFDRLEWFRLTLAFCPPSGKLLALHASDGRNEAWLFLMVERGVARALASWYSLAVRPTISGHNQLNLINALIRYLSNRSPAIARVSLSPVPAAWTQRLGDAFDRNGWIINLGRYSANWTADIAEPDFDAWWRARPGRLRSTVRRKQASAGLDVTIHSHFDADAWADYEAVYAASWKPPEGSPAFLRALAEQEGWAGTLRLGVARRERRAVAAQVWLVENGVATIHKLAHVADADALSPGTLLSAAMFRHAIERDRVWRIDFGAGDEPYKADWMDRRTGLFRLDCRNPRSPRGQLGAWRARAVKLVRRLRND